jgi:cell wall-associated NlpC family hydrolase
MKLLSRALGALLFTSLSVGFIAPATAQAVEPQAPALTQTVTLASASDGSDDIENMLRDTIIAIAKDELAKNVAYVWGGGHASKPGPSTGTCWHYPGPGKCHDTTRVGMDCSGFVRYDLWRAGFGDFALNANGFRTTTHWFRNVSSANAKRGDIILYGDPGDADHVAIYAGIKNGVRMMYEERGHDYGMEYSKVSRRGDILGYRTLF